MKIEAIPPPGSMDLAVKLYVAVIEAAAVYFRQEAIDEERS